MTIRNILLPVRGDGKGEKVRKAAVALAERSGAHIECVHARMRADDMLTFGVSLAGMRDAVNEIAESHAADEEKRVKQLFEEWCTAESIEVVDEPRPGLTKVTASFTEAVGRQADAVALRGRLADIIFVAQPDGQLGVNTFESALLNTGKPVVVVPPLDVSSIGKTIAIAWNGSAEVAGAVTTSRPIIEEAEKLIILSAPEAETHHLPAEDLAKYLRWHGQESETITIECDPHEVGQTLLQTCAANGVDLLIMGGYAQVRRHDFKIGGVTQYVVDNAQIPVLFHH